MQTSTGAITQTQTFSSGTPRSPTGPNSAAISVTVTVWAMMHQVFFRKSSCTIQYLNEDILLFGRDD